MLYFGSIISFSINFWFFIINSLSAILGSFFGFEVLTGYRLTNHQPSKPLLFAIVWMFLEVGSKELSFAVLGLRPIASNSFSPLFIFFKSSDIEGLSY